MNIPLDAPWIQTLRLVLEVAATVAFALSGVMAAARKRLDAVGVCVVAFVAAFGGGTLRDLLLGLPVFWVQDWRYVAVCMVAAVGFWMLGARSWRFRALLWLDAVGLAAYGVMGAAKAASYGVTPLICIVMGVLTACFGGIVRDVLAHQPSILLRRELNITAALVSAALFVGLKAVSLPTWPAVAVAVVAGFGVRAGALKWGWSLPAFPTAASRY